MQADIKKVDPMGISVMRQFPTKCLVFDACFNEANQNQILSGGSDGHV